MSDRRSLSSDQFDRIRRLLEESRATLEEARRLREEFDEARCRAHELTLVLRHRRALLRMHSP